MNWRVKLWFILTILEDLVYVDFDALPYADLDDFPVEGLHLIEPFPLFDDAFELFPE